MCVSTRMTKAPGVHVEAAGETRGERARGELGDLHDRAGSTSPRSRKRSKARLDVRLHLGVALEPEAHGRCERSGVARSAGASSRAFRTSAASGSRRWVSPDPSSKTTNSSSQDFQWRREPSASSHRTTGGRGRSGTAQGLLLPLLLARLVRHVVRHRVAFLLLVALVASRWSPFANAGRPLIDMMMGVAAAAAFRTRRRLGELASAAGLPCSSFAPGLSSLMSQAPRSTLGLYRRRVNLRRLVAVSPTAQY